MKNGWIFNGVHLAWLIDPCEEKARVWRVDGPKTLVEGFDGKKTGRRRHAAGI